MTVLFSYRSVRPLLCSPGQGRKSTSLGIFAPRTIVCALTVVCVCVCVINYSGIGTCHTTRGQGAQFLRQCMISDEGRPAAEGESKKMHFLSPCLERQQTATLAGNKQGANSDVRSEGVGCFSRRSSIASQCGIIRKGSRPSNPVTLGQAKWRVSLSPLLHEAREARMMTKCY